MRAGPDFRYTLLNQFPQSGCEGRKQWFFRVSRLIGIAEARLEKLCYDEKCAVRAHELHAVQKATSGRISKLRRLADNLNKKNRDLTNEQIHQLAQLPHDLLEEVHNIITGHKP